MTILPGLVASGGALLFGVNAWCLDGRGALWRENLPAPPTALFDARTPILAEFLGVASPITILVGALRAGLPRGPELAALVASVLVVTLQVVGACPALVAETPLPGGPPVRPGDARTARLPWWATRLAWRPRPRSLAWCSRAARTCPTGGCP